MKNIGFNSILLLALMLGTGAVSSVTALGDVASVSAVNPLVACSTLTFAAPTIYALADPPSSIAVADLNGDGALDLATANGVYSSVSILLGNGTGSFSAATDFTTVGMSADNMVAGDFNDDSKQDLLIAGNGGDVPIGYGALLILEGDGDGSYGRPSLYSTGVYMDDVALGDFNTDGKQDAAFTRSFLNLYSDVGIALGNGGGERAGFNYPWSRFPLVVDAYPGNVAVGDFNDDGKLDLVTGNGNSTASISILLGDGMGNLGAPTYLSTGYAANVAVGDFNSDGKQDLAATDSGLSSNTVAILLGNGTGEFGGPTHFAVGTAPTFVSVDDFNGDSKQDLAVINQGSNDVSILPGNGDGTFGVAMNLTTGGTGPNSLAVGDFNSDGRQDLAVANGSSRTVSILLNTCQTVPADLSMTMSDTPDPMSAGSTLTYSLAVTNNGSGDATNVIVTDTLPIGVTFDPATSSPGCTELAGVVTCTLGNLANGNNATITINVIVDSGALTGTITNTARVSGNENDPNTSNDTASTDTVVTAPLAPCTILDDFNRANGPLGSNWPGRIHGYSINSNQVAVRTGRPIYWQSEAYGPDQEACVTLTRINPKSTRHGLLLKVQELNNWRKGAILVSFKGRSGNVEVKARDVANHKWILLGTFTPPTPLVDGDQLRAKAFADGTVEVLINDTSIGTVDAGSFYAGKGGQIGLWFRSSQADNDDEDDDNDHNSSVQSKDHDDDNDSSNGRRALFDDFGGGTLFLP